MSALVQRIARYHTLLICTLAVFGFDQLTKLLVIRSTSPMAPTTIPPPFPSLRDSFTSYTSATRELPGGCFRALV
jgi:hypothetical protein